MHTETQIPQDELDTFVQGIVADMAVEYMAGNLDDVSEYIDDRLHLCELVDYTGKGWAVAQLADEEKQRKAMFELSDGTLASAIRMTAYLYLKDEILTEWHIERAVLEGEGYQG